MYIYVEKREKRHIYIYIYIYIYGYIHVFVLLHAFLVGCKGVHYLTWALPNDVLMHRTRFLRGVADALGACGSRSGEQIIGRRGLIG